jgi:hypothetical protein
VTGFRAQPGRLSGSILDYTFLLRFAFFHARVVLRLLLLYRLAVAKRSRVKLAAFFCARLPDFRVFQDSELHRQTQKTAKDGLSSGTVVALTAQLWVCFQPLNPGSGSRSTR